MPRRTIRLGRNPASFSFEDDEGPLVNGLAYAASQFLNAGRDRAELEMNRDEAAAEAAHRANRDRVSDDHWTQDFDLRKQQADAHQQQMEAGNANLVRDDLGATLKGAAELFLKALELNPEYARTHYQLGLLFL